MFWEFLVVLLIILISCLVAYAMYLSMRMHTGKGRFAATVVFAIAGVVPTTVLAVSQFQITDTAVAIVELIRTGSWTPSHNSGLLSKLIDYTIIFSLTFLTIRYLYRFGDATIRNWHGPVTTVEAQLSEQGRSPEELFPLAVYYLRFRASGELELPIDPKTLEKRFSLADAPDSPGWDVFCRELILESNNEIYIPDEEDGWSDEIQAWVGEFAPKYREISTPVFVVPLYSGDQPDIDAAIARLSSVDSVANAKVYLCLPTDDLVFVEGSKTGVNYKIVSKGYLIEDAVNLRSYCIDLVDRFRRMEVLGTGSSLSEMFVEPLVTVEGSEAPRDLADVISAWSQEPSRTQISLVGDFGQGKSSAILAFCAHWAERYLSGKAKGERVPLLITLRGRDPGGLPHADFLATWGDRYRISGKALLNLVIAGRAVLIFEGFDEVNNAGIRRERLKQFNALWRFSYPGSKIIFTGRPNFFLDDDELRRLLRIDAVAAAAGQPATILTALQFFTREQAQAALRIFDASVVSHLLSRFDQDHHFRDIASRPSMLPLLGLIWPQLQVSTGDGTLTSADVIEKYISFEYNRKAGGVSADEVQIGFPKEHNYLQIPRRIREFFMMAVAKAMASMSRANTISGDEFTQCVRAAIPMSEAYLASIEALDEETSYFQRVRDLAREAGQAEVVERISSELRTTGLLVRDVASGSSHLFFPHKQFYEYYLARLAATAVNLRLDKRTRTPFDAFMSVGRPCSLLHRETQALRFFVEVSNTNWYQVVFTTSLSIVDRIALATMLSAFAMANTMVGSAFDLKLDKSIERLSGWIPRGARMAAVLVASILVLAGVTYGIMSSLAVALTLGLFVAGMAMSVALSLRGESTLRDVLLWMELTEAKYPGSSSSVIEKALGPLTTRLLILYGEHYKRRVERIRSQ